MLKKWILIGSFALTGTVFGANKVVWSGQYVVPNKIMDNQTISNFVSTISKVFSAGTYIGKTASGETCSATVSTYNDPEVYPIIEIKFDGAIPGGEFTSDDARIFYPNNGEFFDYLIGLHSVDIGTVTQVQFGLLLKQTETPDQDLILSITGKDGVPSSFTFGAIPPPPDAGGSNSGLGQGYVIPAASIVDVGGCYNLIDARN